MRVLAVREATARPSTLEEMYRRLLQFYRLIKQHRNNFNETVHVCVFLYIINGDLLSS